MNKVHALISRNLQACYTEMNDEIVILNPDDENCYHFNATATDLWKSLDAPKTVLQLSEILAQKYKSTIEYCQQDVLEWIEDTQKIGLLTVKSCS